LLNGVIHRFGRDIQTKRLKVLVDIKDDDYNRIYEAMSKCSCYIEGHDESSELNEPLPIPDEIGADIKNIEDYQKELSSNRKRSPR
jgi:hypothetical protein